MIGALFHTLNHGVFKALLFLNAGSMLHATGTQDLNKMGGLLKYMPLTAATALVASLSISGVPLFNGFASKWTIYVATVQGSHLAGYLAVCAAIAILTSALTLASFVKFFGAGFLSRTSALVQGEGRRPAPAAGGWDDHANSPVDAGVDLPAAGDHAGHRLQPDSARAGGKPSWFWPGPRRAAVPAPGNLWAGLSGVGSRCLFVPLALLAVLGLAFLAAGFISKLGGAPRRAAPPWLCGYAREAECNRYVAHGFYGEIKRYFRWLCCAPAPPGESSPDLNLNPNLNLNPPRNTNEPSLPP